MLCLCWVELHKKHLCNAGQVAAVWPGGSCVSLQCLHVGRRVVWAGGPGGVLVSPGGSGSAVGAVAGVGGVGCESGLQIRAAGDGEESVGLGG